MPDLPGDEVSVTAAPTPVDSTALELAEEMAKDAKDRDQDRMDRARERNDAWEKDGGWL